MIKHSVRLVCLCYRGIELVAWFRSCLVVAQRWLDVVESSNVYILSLRLVRAGG